MSRPELGFDLILKNGRIYSTSGLVDADIGVRAGTIVAIGSMNGDASETITASASDWKSSVNLAMTFLN